MAFSISISVMTSPSLPLTCLIIINQTESTQYSRGFIISTNPSLILVIKLIFIVLSFHPHSMELFVLSDFLYWGFLSVFKLACSAMKLYSACILASPSSSHGLSWRTALINSKVSAKFRIKISMGILPRRFYSE